LAHLHDLVGIKRGPLLSAWKAQLAVLTKEAPDGDQWLHEIKFDGYRMGCRIDNGRVHFISRNGQDWSERVPSLRQAAKKLPVNQAFLDGEVVAMKPDGTTDFQLLQNAFRGERSQELRYYTFDLLHLDGYDLSGVALEERKRVLAELSATVGKEAAIRYSKHVIGNGPAFYRQACERGLEGIVSKMRDRPYVPGRSYDWLKVKCLQKDEFVIGGYADPSGSRVGFGALLLGYYDGDKKLKYAGKVGTGFDHRTLLDLWTRLKALEQRESPFADLRGTSGAIRDVHWVKPQFVAQIAFSNRTRDGMLRHPSFQGLREDKPAGDVVRETPVSVRQAIEASTTATEDAVRRNGRSHKARPHPASTASTHMPRSRAAEPDHRLEEFANVRLTSPGKVMYPDQGITKLELATYYFRIAQWMLPHVANRPLVLVRCPEGHDKECFYQKHPGIGTPKNLRQIDVREKTKMEKYLVVDDAAGLISLAQIGALEIHAWGSRADDIERPDRLIFDLDPDPTVKWARVIESARQVRQFLADIGLQSFVKTTGGKGLHLVVPIQRRHDWDEAKQFCKNVAEVIVRGDPGRYTSNMSKAARTGKIFIDYLRNARGATSIAPYSTRARSGAPVSTPLSWDQLSTAIRPDQFNIRNLPKRLASLRRDPWDGFDAVRQFLSAAVKKKLNL
jgi:bifunctional non-homologous end joining protein LigD